MLRGICPALGIGIGNSSLQSRTVAKNEYNASLLANPDQIMVFIFLQAQRRSSLFTVNQAFEHICTVHLVPDRSKEQLTVLRENLSLQQIPLHQ